MTTPLTDLTEIRKLEERYPFSEEELEILIRCFDHINDSQDDFIMKLASASPYSFFFLPGDAMRDRVNWVEDYVLPAGFANELRASISADAFVEYANQGQNKHLERFLEGIADTGRRGTKEALKVLFNLLDQPEPQEIADFCVRLAVASDAMVVPNLDKTAILAKLEALEQTKESLTLSLSESCKGNSPTLSQFVLWAEEKFPMLSAPLSTFVHSLLFHGHAYPKARIPYQFPNLDEASDIFLDSNSPNLMSLSFTAPQFGGKWHRLYSSFFDGRSFNRMEWSVLGYTGPTLLVIKTTENAILGAFAESAWKESRDFYGNADCFLFELSPSLKVHRAVGEGHNFMYLHSDFFESSYIPDSHGFPHGLGLGGTLSKPRLFIPESFEKCSADFLDNTFQAGELLPPEALEKFEIKCLEIWGVGGDEAIDKGLQGRAKHREETDTVIERARTVHDKSEFVGDMKAGLVPGPLFSHSEQVRGRQEFRVDDQHGGYKLDH